MEVFFAFETDAQVIGVLAVFGQGLDAATVLEFEAGLEVAVSTDFLDAPKAAVGAGRYGDTLVKEYR